MEEFESLLVSSAQTHGHLCPGQVVGVRMAILGCRLIGLDDPQSRTQIEKLIVYVEMDRCTADAVAYVTGVKLGRRSLKFMDYGIMAASFVNLETGRAFRVVSTEASRALAPVYAPEIPGKYPQQLEAYKRMPDSILFRVEEVMIDICDADLPGPTRYKTICVGCGQVVRDRREVTIDGRPYCAPCAGRAYFRNARPVSLSAMNRSPALPITEDREGRESHLKPRSEESFIEERKGDLVAATRAIPLIMQRAQIERAASMAGENGPVLSIKPLRHARAGLVITGNEVYHGLIRDRFAPVLTEKVRYLGSEVAALDFAPDDADQIATVLRTQLDRGCDLLLLTGGMSVDPDDVTRHGIRRAGAGEFHYGSAVLPGAMFLVAYLGDVPLLGVPACTLHHRVTVLDLVLPRVLAGEHIGKADLAFLGHGGLCRDCPECRYPACPFGKGH
ncbi:MAG: FmdE family protein [Syntrophobacteraceae bacterium]|jgi:formylmethanofuran dehydrogenase subunit E